MLLPSSLDVPMSPFYDNERQCLYSESELIAMLPTLPFLSLDHLSVFSGVIHPKFIRLWKAVVSIIPVVWVETALYLRILCSLGEKCNVESLNK
jgi:hypothetical protein